MHYIYIITNIINNKIYIGQTVNPKDRWSTHRKESIWNKQGTNSHLYNAMKMYGKENFSFEVIFIYETLKEANNAETFFIKELNTIENGYNISKGGGNRRHSEATKLKISLAQKGKKRKPHSKETKESISKANKGKVSSRKGIKLNNKTKIKMSLAAKGKAKSEEHCINISLAKSGIDNRSEETKQKMNKLLIGNKYAKKENNDT
jgi:group I intron endonuclease